MNLDVRIPLGWLFLILGGVLLLHGLASDAPLPCGSAPGQNLNCVWGAVWMLFGAGSLILARRFPAN